MDNSKRDVDELAPIEKVSQNGCDSQENSYACERSGNECNNGSNKNIISPLAELDAGNDFNLINSEASVTKELSSARGDESLVLNNSTEEFTESPSKENFRNPSEHEVMH